MTFTQAKNQYVHRYTMDHIPAWVLKPAPNGKFYAPQFASDKEWYDNTVFTPNPLCFGTDCYTNGQTWPLGQWLDYPYVKGGR